MMSDVLDAIEPYRLPEPLEEAVIARRKSQLTMAVLLTVFIYDNPGFQVIERSTNYEQVRAAVDANVESGVEIWQANFEPTPKCVRLRKRSPIEV